AIGPLVADHLGDLLGILGGDALLQADEEAVLLAGRLGLIRNVQDLQGQLPPDQPLLEDVQGRVRALLGAARDLDPVLALPSDGGPGALEVEPLGHFLGGLVQGVVDLLSVELGHDVETGFGGQRVLTPRLFSHGSRAPAGTRAVGSVRPGGRTRPPSLAVAWVEAGVVTLLRASPTKPISP